MKVQRRREAGTGVRRAHGGSHPQWGGVSSPFRLPLEALDARTLVEIQRLAGNAAVMELFAAHRGAEHSKACAPARVAGKGPAGEEPVKGNLAVQRGLWDWLKKQVKKAPAGRASQAVSITTVSGPDYLSPGGSDWKVWFSIGTPAGADGWVIQEVKYDYEGQKSDGSVERKGGYHFWEAWEVKKGKTVTVWQDGGLDDNDDRYYSPKYPAGTKGFDNTYGTAKFYEGPLPADFKTNNPATVAGILHSTTSKPSFWDGSGTAHNLLVTWNDTVSPQTYDLKAVAGGTTIRRTAP